MANYKYIHKTTKKNFRFKMSDDDDIQYIKRKKVVHFGTLDGTRGESSDANIQVFKVHTRVVCDTCHVYPRSFKKFVQRLGIFCYFFCFVMKSFHSPLSGKSYTPTPHAFFLPNLCIHR